MMTDYTSLCSKNSHKVGLEINCTGYSHLVIWENDYISIQIYHDIIYCTE